MDEAVASLSSVGGQPVGTRFMLPNGLELASVGRALVVAGPEAVLGEFRATHATVVVDDLEDCQQRLGLIGARIVRGPQAVPTGRNLTARLPGGAQIEYVEWDQAQWDRVGDQEANADQGAGGRVGPGGGAPDGRLQ
ncbi:MAG: hypothetical protein ACYDH5_04545 [Acidimicrobiales bacterium]